MVKLNVFYNYQQKIESSQRIKDSNAHHRTEILQTIGDVESFHLTVCILYAVCTV